MLARIVYTVSMADDMDDSQSKQESLRGLLRDIHRMRADMRASREETDGLETELEAMRVNRTITELSYVIYIERLRRSREDINYVLRKLDHNRKIALRKLFELDSQDNQDDQELNEG
jgi:hypothetical protein